MIPGYVSIGVPAPHVSFFINCARVAPIFVLTHSFDIYIYIYIYIRDLEPSILVYMSLSVLFYFDVHEMYVVLR